MSDNRVKFKTRYRIVTDGHTGYMIQFRPWWSPFWIKFSANISRSPWEAEDQLREELKRRTRKFDIFVQNVEP